MIAALVAVLFFLTGAGQGGPRSTGRLEREQERIAGLRLPEIRIPETRLPEIRIPEIRIPEIHVPQIDLPDIEAPEFDFEEMVQLPWRFAFAMPRDAEDDEDRADLDRDDDGEVRDDRGARVYKMNQAPRIRVPDVRVGRSGEEDDWDERSATAQAKGRGSAILPVKGPVTFQLRAQSGEIEVSTSDKQQVSVTLSGAPGSGDELTLYAFGDRVEPSFRGRRTLRHGKLRVELPKGSRLDLSSLSGDITAQRLSEVRIRTMSGDVKIASVGKADVQTISGDVRIDDASGPVRLHTVSGHGTIGSASPAPQVEFQSASGDMDWSGVCAKDCHLSAETVSGALRLLVDPKSSFELSYTSHSGELRDELSMTVKRAPRRKHGMTSGWLEATFGRGEGVIEADAFSGNLAIKKR